MSFYLNDFKQHLSGLAEKAKTDGLVDYTEPVRPWQNTATLEEAYRGMHGVPQQLNEQGPFNPIHVQTQAPQHRLRGPYKPYLTTYDKRREFETGGPLSGPGKGPRFTTYGKKRGPGPGFDLPIDYPPRTVKGPRPTTYDKTWQPEMAPPTTFVGGKRPGLTTYGKTLWGGPPSRPVPKDWKLPYRRPPFS